jgi:hypothetical protein
MAPNLPVGILLDSLPVAFLLPPCPFPCLLPPLLAARHAERQSAAGCLPARGEAQQSLNTALPRLEALRAFRFCALAAGVLSGLSCFVCAVCVPKPNPCFPFRHPPTLAGTRPTLSPPVHGAVGSASGGFISVLAWICFSRVSDVVVCNALLSFADAQSTRKRLASQWRCRPQPLVGRATPFGSARDTRTETREEERANSARETNRRCGRA